MKKLLTIFICLSVIVTAQSWKDLKKLSKKAKSELKKATKTKIPLRKPKPSGPLAQKKNMIRNRYGQLVEQKPLGSYTPREEKIVKSSLEHSLMNPVVPTLTHADILQKWKNDTKQMEQLKAKLKRKEDDAKAKKEKI